MIIGIIGGTGGMGKGFALRWCKKHEVNLTMLLLSLCRKSNRAENDNIPKTCTGRK